MVVGSRPDNPDLHWQISDIKVSAAVIACRWERCLRSRLIPLSRRQCPGTRAAMRQLSSGTLSMRRTFYLVGSGRRATCTTTALPVRIVMAAILPLRA